MRHLSIKKNKQISGTFDTIFTLIFHWSSWFVRLQKKHWFLHAFLLENGFKKETKSHCVRRAQTAAPLGGNRRISISGKVFGKRRKRRTSIKATKNGSQKYQKSMKMGSKIDGKSMKSRGRVADAILVRSGSQKAQKQHFFGTPFWNHFRPKIPKNVKKKKSIRSSGTVPERSKNVKKTIF